MNQTTMSPAQEVLAQDALVTLCHSAQRLHYLQQDDDIPLNGWGLQACVAILQNRDACLVQQGCLDSGLM